MLQEVIEYDISEEFDPAARRAVEQMNRILFQVHPQTLGDLVGLHRSQFDFVASSSHLREIIPPQTQMAINPSRVAIPRSNGWKKSLSVHQKIAADQTQELQERTGRKDIAVTIFPGLASAVCQADIEYQHDNKGRSLIIAGRKRGSRFFLRTADEDFLHSDKSTASFVAYVGRDDPGHNLVVNGTFFDIGSPFLWAPSVVVPVRPRK